MTDTIPAPTISPRSIYTDEVAPESDADVAFDDLKLPDSMPTTETETRIRLANRVLEWAVQQEGHHSKLSRTLTGEWADKYRDHEYFRRQAFALTPRELHGQISIDEQDTDDDTDAETQAHQKANTVLAFVSEHYDNADVIHSKAADVADEIAATLTDALEDATRIKRGKAFLASPPAEHNSWERIDVPGYALGYYGCHADDETTRPVVALLFEMAGYVRAWTVTASDFAQEIRHLNGLDTEEMQSLRFRRISNPESWADGAVDLREHLADTPGDQTHRPHFDTLDPDAVGGRTGPYPADKRRFDPTDATLPGEWSLASHTVSGNQDLTEREEAVFEHPYYGGLRVSGKRRDDANNGRWKFGLTGANILPELDPATDNSDEYLTAPTKSKYLQRRLSREEAYDLVIELITANPTAPDRLWEAATTIADAQDAALDDENDTEWDDVEAIAADEVRAAVDAGHDALEVHRMIRVANRMGSEPKSNLPTFRPLRDAGVVHPDMSDHEADEARRNRPGQAELSAY